MVLRRVLWALIGTLALLAVAGGTLLGWTMLRPKSPATTTALLISDEGSNLRMLVEGQEASVVGSDVKYARFRYPAVSPDGRKVAYVGANGDALAIYSLDLTTGERHVVYKTSVVAPFDLGWSPDGKQIVFLAQGPGSLVLLMAPESGASEPQPVAAGGTIYFSWSDDSKMMALHVGGHSVQNGRVDVFKAGESSPTSLSGDPGFFQAPAISRDGSAIFYVAQPEIKQSRLTYEEVASAVVRVGADGKEPKVLASEKHAALRVVRSPTSDTLAYAVQRLSQEGGFEWGELKVVNPDGGEPRVISQPNDKIDAFFWSPDGSKIAYLSYKDKYDVRSPRTLKVADVSSGDVRELATFTPSEALADLNVFFDAYSHGYTPWSPDSTRLSYSTNDGIYVAEAKGGTPRKVGDGTMALWVSTERKR